MSWDFCVWFFVKQIPLVLSDTLRNNFDFNTIIEELFDFNGDFPGVFTTRESQLPGVLSAGEFWLHGVFISPGKSRVRCIHYRKVTSLTPPCIHCQGVENPQCIQHRVELTPRWIHYRGVKIPRCHHKGSRLPTVFTTGKLFLQLWVVLRARKRSMVKKFTYLKSFRSTPRHWISRGVNFKDE